MEGYHPIVTHMLTANYLAVFVLWYFAYGTFAYNFSYEGTRGGFFLPLYALADDLYLQLPGRKAAFIRKQVDQALDRGHGGGYLGGRLEDDWSYENIRKNDLYAKVGAAMLPGTFYAFVITAPLLYPVYSWAWKTLFPA